MIYIADFETTTESPARVWGWAACNIEDENDIYMNNSIDSFMNWCEDMPENILVYFVNLKWDGNFILSYLLRCGFKHVTNPRDRADNTFTTIINEKGMFYCIEVVFWRKGRNIKKVTFWDLYKLIPLSVEDMAESFDMPYRKGKIDYDAHNGLPENAPISDKEKEYLKTDVRIPARAVKYFHEQGLNKMTIGSCAMNEYINLIGRKTFNRLFPPPQYHEDVKQAYRGGYNWVNPKFKGKIVDSGIVLDKNSMYPAVMKYEKLPHGTPIFYKGKYVEDKVYPLYIQMISCAFELKKGKMPTAQMKYSLYFNAAEYATSSNDEELVLILTNLDLELFLENYDTYNLEYISGWKFKAKTGMFDAYIDKWNDIKIQATEENNHGMRLISKLYLNNLSGKFGTGIFNKTKIPYLDEEEGIVKYKKGTPEEKDGGYVPMAAFITSYGRYQIIKAGQKIMDDYNSGKSNIQLTYIDTDSLHCISPDYSIPEGLEIDNTKLGAFKIEGKFKRAKYLRTKCYIQDFTKKMDDENYKLKATVAGMPKGCHEQITFNNFKIGAKYSGKKTPHLVKGGVILEEIDFTIKE